ncbi:hypothetical protein, partial [Salmonella sp. SAL4356]|uniref:hypothetical protein n=1 Tax=Salmonella sp. SAL4356 TaxID=3159877 RepID=UPI003978B8C1
VTSYGLFADAQVTPDYRAPGAHREFCMPRLNLVLERIARCRERGTHVQSDSWGGGGGVCRDCGAVAMEQQSAAESAQQVCDLDPEH